jgi:hypothetical protein
MFMREVVICLLLISAFASGSLAGDCLPKTVDLVTAPDVTTWGPAPYRWRDIATNLYSLSYRETYTYDSASVTATFEACGESTLVGHLSAINLKPNFAYQVKLVGKPERLWGAIGDDDTNERIGFTGRWWRRTPDQGNSWDGRDSQGNQVAGGLYFYHVEIPGGPAGNGKVVLLRNSD